jgi:hypothetical protein
MFNSLFFLFMKRKIFSCMAASVLFCASISAQVFIIERSGNSLAYSNIKAAVDALQDDDHLYLPPGEYSLNEYNWDGYDGTNYSKTLCVNKKVSIYGGGYANGSNSTVLKDGAFIIGKDAGGSLITGIRFRENCLFRMDNVSNCIVSRCLAESFFLLYGAGDNNIITECEFKSTVGANESGYINGQGNGLSCIFSKCIFAPSNHYLRASNVYNCIFLNGNNIFSDACTFNNNIFILNREGMNSESTIVSGTQNSYSNNLWVGGTPSASDGSNNTFNNEITNEPYANVFVNAGAGDYHLKGECRGKNAGIDSKDVGIYGTNVPFKENRLPSIPNFSIKAISPETDTTGKLPVHIVIDAQER